MYFPGKDYICYVMDPMLGTADVREELKRSGLDGIFFSGKIKYGPEAMKAINHELRYLDMDIGFIDEDHVTVLRNGEKREYPVWDFPQGGRFYKLLEYVENYDTIFCRNTMRQVRYSSHSDTPEKIFVKELWEVIRANPTKKFIVFGNYSVQIFFQMGFSGGILPRNQSREGSGLLSPTGRWIWSRDWDGYQHLVTVDYDDELIEKGNYRHYVSIRNCPIYLKNTYELVKRIQEASDMEFAEALESVKDKKIHDFLVTIHNNKAPYSQLWWLPGDRSQCDLCSVSYACTLYQKGGLCILPGTDGIKLSSYFNTRDADKVLEGMGHILATQVDRYQWAVDKEHARMQELDAKRSSDDEETPEFRFDPEISKLANDVQKNAATYAKLLNPSLANPKIGVQINGGKAELIEPTKVTPQLMAQAARELEEAGISREEQTVDAIYQQIALTTGGPVISETQVIDGVTSDF